MVLLFAIHIDQSDSSSVGDRGTGIRSFILGRLIVCVSGMASSYWPGVMPEPGKTLACNATFGCPVQLSAVGMCSLMIREGGTASLVLTQEEEVKYQAIIRPDQGVISERIRLTNHSRFGIRTPLARFHCVRFEPVAPLPPGSDILPASASSPALGFVDELASSSLSRPWATK